MHASRGGSAVRRVVSQPAAGTGSIVAGGVLAGLIALSVALTIQTARSPTLPQRAPWAHRQAET